MAAWIEHLESREFLSATAMPHIAADRGNHFSVVTRPHVQGQMMLFQGAATDAGGQSVASIQMFLSPVAGGKYNARVTLFAGNVQVVTVPISATGAFTFTHTAQNFTLNINGQLASDNQSISGSWTVTASGQTQSGSILLNRSQLLQPKQMQFVGRATGGTASFNLQITVIQTDTGYLADVAFTDSQNNTNGLVVTVSAAGAFTYDNSGSNGAVHVTGQMTGNTITGTFTITNQDGSVTSGTISAKRV